MTEIRLSTTTTAGEEVFFTFDTDDIESWHVRTVYGTVEGVSEKNTVVREMTGDCTVDLTMEMKKGKRPMWSRAEEEEN